MVNSSEKEVDISVLEKENSPEPLGWKKKPLNVKEEEESSKLEETEFSAWEEEELTEELSLLKNVPTAKKEVEFSDA